MLQLELTKKTKDRELLY